MPPSEMLMQLPSTLPLVCEARACLSPSKRRPGSVAQIAPHLPLSLPVAALASSAEEPRRTRDGLRSRPASYSSSLSLRCTAVMADATDDELLRLCSRCDGSI